MSSFLQRAIAESKKREEKATRGPFDAYFETGLTPMVVTYTEGKNGYRTLKDAIASGCKYQDAQFFAAARTWEPKWREMVEMMREVIEGFVTGPGTFARRVGFIDGDKKTEFGMLMENSEHKAHAVLAELERLAKGVFEENAVGAKHLEGLGEK